MKRILLLLVPALLGWTSRAQTYVSFRPAPEDRLFVSEAVEQTIAEIQSLLKNPKLAWQNTLFGELILKLVREGKLDLLNSL